MKLVLLLLTYPRHFQFKLFYKHIGSFGPVYSGPRLIGGTRCRKMCEGSETVKMVEEKICENGLVCCELPSNPFCRFMNFFRPSKK